MRALLLSLVLPLLLAGCTVATRARSPAEILGLRSSESFKLTLDESGDVDECTELQIQRLRNEFLQRELDECKEKPPVPDPEPDTGVNVPVQVKPVEIELVPKTAGFPVPKPLSIVPAGG